MTTRYLLRTAVSDLGGGADFSRKLTPGFAGTLSSISVPIAAGATEISYGFCEPGDPGSDGGTGAQTYTVQVEFSSISATGLLAIYLTRINASGVAQTGPLILGAEQASAANLTFTGSVDLGTFGATDRLRVDYRFRNSASMSSITMGIRCETGTTDVVAPWNLSPKLVSGGTSSGGARLGPASFSLYAAFSVATELGGANYAVGDTIAGLTLKVNGGTAVPLKYVSGEGGSTWGLRADTAIVVGDVLTLSYDPAVGNLLAVTGGVEIASATDLSIANDLTKHVSFYIKDAAGNLGVGSTRYAIFKTSQFTTDTNWMLKEQDGATGGQPADGWYSLDYAGGEPVGAQVFICVHTVSTPMQSLYYLVNVDD